MINILQLKKLQVRNPSKSRARNVTEPSPSEKEETEEVEKEEQTPSPTDLEKLKHKTAQKTEQAPASENEKESNLTFSDQFIAQIENIKPFRIKSVELPKIIFTQHKNTQSIKEKSTIMVYVYTMPVEDQLYTWKELFQAAKKNTINFSIKWLDEKGKTESEWAFGGARVQGIDLGNAAYEKPQPSEGAIEISYDTVNIDGIEF